jgi:hypothetical protein
MPVACHRLGVHSLTDKLSLAALNPRAPFSSAPHFSFFFRRRASRVARADARPVQLTARACGVQCRPLPGIAPRNLRNLQRVALARAELAAARSFFGG